MLVHAQAQIYSNWWWVALVKWKLRNTQHSKHWIPKSYPNIGWWYCHMVSVTSNIVVGASLIWSFQLLLLAAGSALVISMDEMFSCWKIMHLGRIELGTTSTLKHLQLKFCFVPRKVAWLYIWTSLFIFAWHTMMISFS